MRAIVVFTAAVMPLAIAPGFSFFHDVVPKAVIILIAAAAALLIAARDPAPVAAIATHQAGKQFIALLGALAVVTLVSTVLSAHRELAWAGSDWRRFGAVVQIAIMILAVAIAAAGPGMRDVFLRSLCVSGMIAALYGIAQYFGQDPFLPSAAYHAGEGPFQIVRPPATLGHSDYFGAFLLWPLFAGIGIACTDSAWLWKYSGAATAGLAFFAIVLSGSRGAVLGAICGFCCVMFLSRRTARVVAATFAAVAILSGTVYFSPAGARLRARLHWIGDERLGGARILLWRDSLSMSVARPIRGFGPENFTPDFPKYQSVELSRAYPDFYHESPHNFVLDALTSGGVPGAILLVALIAVGIAAGIRKPDAALVPAVTAAVIAHQFSVLTAPSAFCLFAAIALLLRSSRATDSPPAANPAELLLRCEPRSAACTLLRNSRTTDSRDAAKSAELPLRCKPRPATCALIAEAVPRRDRACVSLRTAPLIAASAAAVLFVWTAWRFADTDHAFASVQRHMDAGQYRTAAEQYRRITAALPASTADLYFSRRWAEAAAQAPDALSKLSFADLANVAAVRATRCPELQANAWYNLAALSAASNRPRATEAALRAAAAAAPNWFKPHWALARLLNLTTRRDEALREARRASDLDGGRDGEVTATFEEIVRR